MLFLRQSQMRSKSIASMFLFFVALIVILSGSLTANPVAQAPDTAAAPKPPAPAPAPAPAPSPAPAPGPVPVPTPLGPTPVPAPAPPPAPGPVPAPTPVGPAPVPAPPGQPKPTNPTLPSPPVKKEEKPGVDGMIERGEFPFNTGGIVTACLLGLILFLSIFTYVMHRRNKSRRNQRNGRRLDDIFQTGVGNNNNNGSSRVLAQNGQKPDQFNNQRNMAMNPVASPFYPTVNRPITGVPLYGTATAISDDRNIVSSQQQQDTILYRSVNDEAMLG